MAPCLKSAVSMAYVDTAHSALGTKLKAIVRGKPVDATVVKMPFVPNRYYKKP
jgi:aminomethyltransferase